MKCHFQTNRFTSIFMSIHVSRQKAVYQGGAENFKEILFTRPQHNMYIHNTPCKIVFTMSYHIVIRTHVHLKIISGPKTHTPKTHFTELFLIYFEIMSYRNGKHKPLILLYNVLLAILVFKFLLRSNVKLFQF